MYLEFDEAMMPEVFFTDGYHSTLYPYAITCLGAVSKTSSNVTAHITRH